MAVNITSNQLTRLASDILRAAGARKDEAELVADNLVEANLRGHDTHGIVRLPRYVGEIQRGEINTSAQVRVTQDRPATLLVDADWGFGQVAANTTVDLLVEKARNQGMASAGVFHCNDVARLGSYTTRIAESGMVGLMTVNDGGGSPHVAPWGGIQPLLSTNPLSFAVPLDDAAPICIDMSTSMSAASRISLTMKRGEQVPPGLILNAEGKTSSDPGDLFADPPGSLLPLGAPLAGHKGFALSLIVDILSGALAGAGCSGADSRETQGLFLLVIHIEAFTPRDLFQDRVGQLIERIKANPRAQGVDEIRIPGEQAARERTKRLESGIEVQDSVWGEIIAAAETLDLRV